jgi:N-acetyl-anhydromuramyl-L-alanine amidase AmpD
MAVSDADADWPYPRLEEVGPPPGEPTWECPGGDCSCHPPGGELLRRPHQLVFCDVRGHRMSRARCRVLENGKLLNQDDGKASLEGALTVDVLPTTKSLRLQWAPENTPKAKRYPYEKLYHLDVGQSVRDGVERRLDNLGYCAESTLETNICAFERAYHLDVTGDAQRVEPTLIAFHDAGLLPPVPPPLVPAKPQHTPPKPAPGNPPGAAPGQRPAGTVAPTERLTITFRLLTRFFLDDASFEPQSDDWAQPDGSVIDSHRYNLRRMVKELGGTSEKELDKGKAWRWTPKSVRRVAGAKCVLTVSKGEGFIESTQVTKNSKPDGSVTFSNVEMNFEDFPLGAPANMFLRVEPPPGTRAPAAAGPEWPPGKITKDFLYRGFSIAMHIDNDGVLQADSVNLFDVSKPPHVELMTPLPIKAVKKGFVIELDWRPDWVRGKSAKRTIDSRYLRRELTDKPSATVAEPLLVIHETGNQNVDGGAILAFFHSTKAKKPVSAHYVVHIDGHVVKMVDETEVSFHGNPSVWQDRDHTNEFSVGIEVCHTNTSIEPFSKKATGEDDVRRVRRFPKEQLEAVRRLTQAIVKIYKVKPSRVIGHSDLNFRSTNIEFRNDPSEMFDWKMFEDLALTSTRRPYTGSDPMLRDLHGSTPSLPKNPGKLTKAEVKVRQAKIVRVKELLWEIGYAVRTAPILAGTPRGQRTRQLGPPPLTGNFGAGLEAAVKAFQLRHFSGERRRYLFRSAVPTPSGVKPPTIGTLDQPTLTAIVDVWNDKQARG